MAGTLPDPAPGLDTQVTMVVYYWWGIDARGVAEALDHKGEWSIKAVLDKLEREGYIYRGAGSGYWPTMRWRPDEQQEALPA